MVLHLDWYTYRMMTTMLNMHHMCFLYFLLSTLTTEGRCLIPETLGPQLKQCDFSDSGIRSIHVVNISPECQCVDLSRNRLTTIEDFVFAKLTKLLALDLSHNNIVNLNSKCFSGLNKLESLDLSHNSLNLSYKAYPEVVFIPLIRLKILDIGDNILLPTNDYPDKAIGVLTSLKQLTIDMFADGIFGNGFSKLKQLNKLICSPRSNSLISVQNDTFALFQDIPVTSLVLNDCNVKTLEEMAFQHFPKLKQISLRGSHHIGLANAMLSLKGLSKAPLSDVDFSFVNGRSIPFTDQQITADMFKYLQPFCLQKLDLGNNILVYMNSSSLYQLNPHCLQFIGISNFVLSETSVLDIFVFTLRFQQLRNAQASGLLFAKPTFHKNAAQLYDSEIVISVPSHLEVFNISNTFVICRPNQVVIIQNASSIRLLDWSYSKTAGCFDVKITGLDRLQTLIISGNEYTKGIPSAFLSSFPNLTKLVARDTPLMTIFTNKPTIFSSLSKLQHLDIRHSELTSIPSLVFDTLKDLKYLDLSYNKLVEIPESILALSDLQQLDVRWNVLSSISRKVRDRLDFNVETTGKFTFLLSGNPLICNCDTYDFAEWIWTSKVTFDNNGNYSCTLNNGSVIPLLSLREHFRDHRVRCISTSWLIFGTVSVSIVIVMLLVSSVVFRYRVPLKYWYHTLCRKPEAKPNQRHKYDALVAYCHQDYRWVYQTLYPKLTDSKQGNGYKLCVYDRDFIPGVPIEENIINAINDSFKIILVISPAFVQSTWCQFELQMARMKMIQVGREDVVIPIILKDVHVSLMPKSLLNLWNTSVFLVWSESPGEQRHFWVNLRAALGPARVVEALEVDRDGEIEGRNDDHQPLDIM